MYSPEEFFPVLERMAALLERCEIRFHVTGGLVAIHYAEPRLTQDIDLVIDPVQFKNQLEVFLSAVQAANYIANTSTIREAAERGRMFQLIDSKECLKVDLYPRELAPGALDRSVWVDVTPQLRIPFASRADVIASKIVWISKGSHKSRRDVRWLMYGATAVESSLARELVESLGLSSLLEEVLAEPDEIDA